MHPSTRWGVHLLPHPYRRRHAVEFVRRKRAEFRQHENLALAITTRDSGVLIGMIELAARSIPERRYELGYWISPEHRGKGYASEAARTMCRVGFEILGLHRIEAGALSRNRASIRVLEKAGLRHEGVFRRRAKVGKRWLDEVFLARVKEE